MRIFMQSQEKREQSGKSYLPVKEEREGWIRIKKAPSGRFF
jgi:hypothetical protein